MTRLPKYAAALVAAGALAASGVATAAPAATSGAIQIIGTTTTANGNTQDLVTGVINDYGYDKSVTQTTEKIVLKKGTFLVDGRKLKFSDAKNKVGCSASYAGVGSNLPVGHGTGAYKNISGTVNVRVLGVALGKVVNGKCNLNKEIAGRSYLIGTGHVSY